MTAPDIVARLRATAPITGADRAYAAALIDAQLAAIQAMNRTIAALTMEGGAHDIAKSANAMDGAGEVPFGERAKTPAPSSISAEDYLRARDIAGRPSVIGVFAAPEWDELSDTERNWIAAIVREARHGH